MPTADRLLPTTRFALVALIAACASACASLVPLTATRAVEVARRNVCGTAGSATDSACTVREYERMSGGYRVVLDRRPPAGSDRVEVRVRGSGSRVEVVALDTVAPGPPR